MHGSNSIDGLLQWNEVIEQAAGVIFKIAKKESLGDQVTHFQKNLNLLWITSGTNHALMLNGHKMNCRDTCIIAARVVCMQALFIQEIS